MHFRPAEALLRIDGTTYASPLTVTSTGYVNAGTNGANGAAVYAAAPAALTLINQGRIKAAGTVIGVDDGAASSSLSVNNTGTITAAADAVYLRHGDTVTNS